MSFALYVHIPFCVRKCTYCDFESHAGRLDQADNYIDCVLSEARQSRALYGAERLKSAYIGGGTPSLLNAKQLDRLLNHLFILFPPEEDAEITVEANPGTLTPDFLKAAQTVGVNRLSLGVQASQEHLLRLLGRIHTFDEATQAVDMAEREGFDNISCDVMFALPTQTTEELIDTLEGVCALGIKHLSCYSLILEEGTALHRRISAGEIALPDEELCRQMQMEAVAFLESKCLRRYEISNFARPGYESLHNLTYWTGGEYLGLGCAAHSYMRGERFRNPDLDSYMRGETHIERSLIAKPEQLEEAIMLQTRLTRGIDLDQIRREFGQSVVDRLCRNAGKYPTLAEISPHYLRLTGEGFMVQNALVLELLDKLIN